MALNRWLSALMTGLLMYGLTAPASGQSSRVRASASVDLQARLKEVVLDPKLSAAAMKTGRKVAAVCDNCHGEGGNSHKPDIPNLASQNPVYHLEQLRQYATGQRQDHFMEGMIKAMNSDEKIGMVLFYAEQKVLPKPASNAALVARGQAYYNKSCLHCHSENGHGDEKLARVAGQQPVYLRESLKRYRAKVGVRLNSRMAASAQPMTDSDIDAMVAYLMSMP